MRNPVTQCIVAIRYKCCLSKEIAHLKVLAKNILEYAMQLSRIKEVESSSRY